MELDVLWIQSDIAEDGTTYVVTVKAGERTWVLTKGEALAYAATVLTAVARAEYDAAVITLLSSRLSLDYQTAVEFVAADLRPNRPKLDDAATSPLRWVPGVSMQTGKGFLVVELDGEAVGQLDPPQAREHAMHAAEATAVVDLDQGFYLALTGLLSLEDARARQIVQAVGDHR